MSPRSSTALLLVLLTLACSASAERAQGWRGMIHDAHLWSILEAEKRAKAVNEALPADAYGLADLPQVRELLAAPSLPLQRSELPGDWRCRSLQVGQLGVFVYPFFRCRIRKDKDKLFFEKLTGSQRRSGEIFEDPPNRFVLLGGQTVNEDPQRPYSATMKDWDEEDLDGDTIGVLTRKGKDRLLMILDATADSYELYELVR